MEYVLCCLCRMLCFLCGGWAARGMMIPRRRQKPQPRADEPGMDTLSRDIAAMLAYTIPGKEEKYDEK